MIFEKSGEIKKQPSELAVPWKPNLVEKTTQKIETADLLKRVDRLVAHTIRVNDRMDRPLLSDLRLKDLAPLLKGADLGQIVQCAVRFETQKMLSAPADYITEKQLEAFKLGAAVHFGDFSIAIDKESIHDFLLTTIDHSAVAEWLGSKELLRDIEEVRYEIISYIEQLIYDAIKATTYLALCFGGGVSRVAEYAFDFTAGTVLSFTDPEFVEALYKKDFTSEVMQQVDKIYGESEIIKKIGDVAEMIGSLAAFMALCAIAAPETTAGITVSILGTALYFAEESGRSIKTLVSESGEYSGKEFFAGVVNGTMSVCMLYLIPPICEKTKDLGNKAIIQTWQWIVDHGLSDHISRETVSKTIGILYGATRGCFQSTLNEISNITNEKLAEIAGMKDEADISIRNSLIHIGVGGLLGAGSYALKDMMTGSQWTSIELEEMVKKQNEIVDEYFDDLKNKSEYPDTIAKSPFDSSDLKKISPEENAKMREEFVDLKSELKSQWEINTGNKWPQYEKDVYSLNGNLIRRAGSDYDAHHIHPLGLGGKNTASNITPLSAEVHYDKQGVHAPDSPYAKLDSLLRGI